MLHRFKLRLSFVVISAGLIAAVVACESSDSTPGGGIGSTGGLDGGNSDARGNVDGSTNDAGADGAPASPVAHDRFRHEWPVTKDEPADGDYIVDGDAGVVTDKVTGLQWTRDLLLQEQTTYDGGYGPGSVSPESQHDARAFCAAATVGGLTGWRLPTMVEMFTIVSLSSHDWNNPNVFTDTSYGAQYFVDSNTTDRFEVYDNHYHPWSFRQSSGSASIRCVRTNYPVVGPVDPPAGRYIVKTGTAVDTITKLEWEIATSNESLLYGQATDYCTNLSATDAGVPAGGSPWRVPSLKELATIWSEAAGGLEPTVFGPVNNSGYLWSSNKYWTTISIPDNGQQVRFEWYDKAFFWETKWSLSPVKCVRDAQ